MPLSYSWCVRLPEELEETVRFRTAAQRGDLDDKEE